jgi:hypothetical protein
VFNRENIDSRMQSPPTKHQTWSGLMTGAGLWQANRMGTIGWIPPGSEDSGMHFF